MLQTNAAEYITLLEELEPVFIDAARHALRLQPSAHSYHKQETGNEIVDIVTSADLEVQELLLGYIARTDLVNCVLMAEENTVSTAKFSQEGTYYLSVDPIDGTALYANGDDQFSTIISLHNGKKILYTFVHVPAWNWTIKIVHDQYITIGKAPEIALPPGVEDIIFCGSKKPEEKLSPDLIHELHEKGLRFGGDGDIGSGMAPLFLFAEKKIAGIYREDTNVYDGMVEFTIASARGQVIHSGGSIGSMNLTDIKRKSSGLYYPGYYLALNTD